jgi:hypothetical protein
MLDLEKLPKWFTDEGENEEGYLRFVPFTKAHFFLLDKKVNPFGSIEFPQDIEGRIKISGEEAMVVNGLTITSTSNPRSLRVRTNTNEEYDVKFSTDSITLEPEVDGEDISFTVEEGGLTPAGDPFTRLVISPLSSDELAAVKSAYIGDDS